MTSFIQEVRKEQVACDLCGGNQVEVLFKARDLILEVSQEAFPVVKCRGCGLVFVNPRPARDEMGRFYPTERYYSMTEASTQSRGIRRVLKRAVYHTYSEKQGWLPKVALWPLQLNIQVVVPGPPGRLLDVGCGNGSYLDLMKQVGWQTFGVEPGAAGAQYARSKGHKIFQGELLDAQYQDACFDALVLCQVLEHVWNPVETLKECYRVLRPGGTIVVDVPNFEICELSVFGPCWYALHVPHHLYHFSKRTLQLIMEQAGFEITKWRRKWWVPNAVSTSLTFMKKSGLSDNEIWRAYWRAAALSLLTPFRPLLGDRFAHFIAVYATKPEQAV